MLKDERKQWELQVDHSLFAIARLDVTVSVQGQLGWITVSVLGQQGWITVSVLGQLGWMLL